MMKKNIFIHTNKTVKDALKKLDKTAEKVLLVVDKENRLLEWFKCIVCGYEDDADYNASKNISYRGVYSPSTI